MTIPELEEELRKRDARIKEQAARIEELEREIEELKKLLVEKAKSKEAKAPKKATNYSVDCCLPFTTTPYASVAIAVCPRHDRQKLTSCNRGFA